MGLPRFLGNGLCLAIPVGLVALCFAMGDPGSIVYGAFFIGVTIEVIDILRKRDRAK